MERPVAELWIFPTLVTLNKVFLTNEKLEKIATSQQGFYLLVLLSTEKALFETKHINTFMSKKGRPIFVFNNKEFTHLMYACLIKYYIFTLSL